MRRQAAAIREAFRDEENKPVPIEIKAIRDFSLHYEEQLNALGLEKLNDLFGYGLDELPTKGQALPVGKGRIVREARKGAPQRVS